MIGIKQLYKPIAFRKSTCVPDSYHKWGYEIPIGKNVKNRRRNSDYMHVRKYTKPHLFHSKQIMNINCIQKY
jgi:hypothetical protein